jgi:hypothetical protein
MKVTASRLLPPPTLRERLHRDLDGQWVAEPFMENLFFLPVYFFEFLSNDLHLGRWKSQSKYGGMS